MIEWTIVLTIAFKSIFNCEKTAEEERRGEESRGEWKSISYKIVNQLIIIISDR